MSHFAVMVIGGNVEEQLQPFHEYECTGIRDEYVEFDDRTQEVLDGFEKDTVTTVTLPDGKVVSKYSAEARELEDQNLVESETPVKLFYDSINEYAADYHGYEPGERPGTFGRWTNLNAKWDWWVVGGRWRGFLKAKDPDEMLVGEPGVFGNEAEEGWGDSLFKGNIDIEGMREAARVQANEEYDKFEAAVAGYAVPEFKSWPELRESMDVMDEAREIYNEHPYIKAIKEAQIGPWFDCPLEYFRVHTGGREAFVQNAVNGCMTPFAVVKDGEWYERGSMGWWGIVTDEQDGDSWNEQFTKLIDEVSDDTLITIVDCHI